LTNRPHANFSAKRSAAEAWLAEDKKSMGYSKEDPIPFIKAKAA